MFYFVYRVVPEADVDKYNICFCCNVSGPNGAKTQTLDLGPSCHILGPKALNLVFSFAKGL